MVPEEPLLVMLVKLVDLIPSDRIGLHIMPKRIQLETHVETAELERRYRAANDPVERTHLQIIWLLSRGKLTREVVEATGYSSTWIHQIARRYNRDGVVGLRDGRHLNAGGESVLSIELRGELARALDEQAPDGGFWTGPKVAEWIGRKVGHKVHKRTGWKYLKRLGYSPKVPRPAHEQADKAEQAEFPKEYASG